MNKIESANALAKACELFDTDEITWDGVMHRVAFYRSASVPSDEDLAEVAKEAYRRHNMLPWKEMMVVIAAAVREWVQSDGLTDEEREAVIALVDCHLANAELRASILRKLGREPEPVWEWDNANARWTLGGKVDRQVFPCASVMLSSGGLLARVYLSEMNATSVNVDSFKEACEWCEQKIREARQ